MAADLTDADYAALADFRFTLRQFMAFTEKNAEACGLTPQQHQALLTIRAAPVGEATVGRVAERLILKPHSATGLVDRLEALGFVRRRASERDRRQALLELSERAHVVLAELSATHKHELHRLRPLLIGLLEKVAE